MDDLEHLVCEFLWMEGNWARTSVMVELNPRRKASDRTASVAALETGRCSLQWAR